MDKVKKRRVPSTKKRGDSLRAINEAKKNRPAEIMRRLLELHQQHPEKWRLIQPENENARRKLKWLVSKIANERGESDKSVQLVITRELQRPSPLMGGGTPPPQPASRKRSQCR